MKFEQCKKIWNLANESYKGIGGFLDGEYLNQYVREDDDKFKERKEIAYYTNIFAPKVNRYVGYIYKKLPIRNHKNSLLNIILKDVNNKGDNLNVFMSNFATNAKVSGVNLVLVDMPQELPNNLSEQIEERALPYLTEISPYRVTKYQLDRFGKFEYVYFDDTMIIDDKVENISRFYDKNTWQVLKDDETIEQGEHGLGVCPVVIFSENGDFINISEFSQVAPLAKRHYNLQSELDEILRYQTFPTLTIQGVIGDDIEVRTGSSNALVYSENVARPDFIAPPSAPAELIQSRLRELESHIAAICYDMTANQSQESGIALDIKFQGLNSSLSSFSSRLEDFEYRVLDVICLYLNIKNDIEIMYPKTFSIIDVTKEIEIYSAMKDLIDAPSYFKQKAIEIISNDLSNIDTDVFDIIKAEIEDGGKEV